jgi:hypothetical protein
MISMILISWLLLMGPIPQVLSFGLPETKDAERHPQITVAESNFILMDYGIRLDPKKLNKRERLALALTNRLDDGQ